MKTQTTPTIRRSNIRQTSIMNTSRSSIATNILRKQESLKQQTEDLKRAQQLLAADIKIAKEKSSQIAAREHDINEIEKTISDFEELMEISNQRQIQSTNILKHSEEMKKQSIQYSSLPSTPQMSMDEIQLRAPVQGQKQDYGRQGQKNSRISTENKQNEAANDEEKELHFLFEISPNHQKSEQILRLEKFVDELKNSAIQHEKKVLEIEEKAREKQIRNAVQIKLNMAADRARIAAEQKHKEIIMKYKSDVKEFQVLNETRQAENVKLEEQLDKKAELDIKELEIKLQEELFNKSIKGSVQFEHSQEKEFPVVDIEETDNDEFIKELEMKAFEEEEKLTEEETLLMKELEDAKRDLEIAKKNAEENEKHVDEVLNEAEEAIKATYINSEEIAKKEQEYNEIVQENEKRRQEAAEEIEKLTGQKAEMQKKINDTCSERLEIANSVKDAYETQAKKNIKIDDLNFEITALMVQRENIMTLVELQEIRERADQALLDVLKSEFVENDSNKKISK